MLDIYIIGCGGIGGYLLQLLPAALVSCTLDIIQDGYPGKSAQLLRDCGNVIVPSIANRLVLVDGDSFDPHNTIRQVAGAGSKLAVQLQMLQESMLRQIWLKDVEIFGVDTYVKPQNIANIIPRTLVSPFPYSTKDKERSLYNPAFMRWMMDTLGYYQWPLRDDTSVNPRNYRGVSISAQHLQTQSIPVVFLCVDNHKTRYQVHKYMETFRDCILINGGNSKFSGNATIYQKRNGVQLDPKIYELYPEIANGQSKRPDELSCTQVSRQHDQIAIVNNMLASIMCNLFRKAVSPTDSLNVTSRNKTKRMNEVIIQCAQMTMVPMFHQVREEQEGRN